MTNSGTRFALTWPYAAPIVAGAVVAAFAAPAHAQRIENQFAVFAALDKVTARIQKLEVKLGETQKFGALKITPRSCYSRPPAEPPKTTTFVQVDEIQLDGSEKPIFAGWMFAESPGLNAVEHPVFDVWLTECGHPKTLAAAPVAPGTQATVPAKPGAKGAAAATPPTTSGWTPGPATGPAAGTAPPAAGEDPNRRRRPPR